MLLSRQRGHPHPPRPEPLEALPTSVESEGPFEIPRGVFCFSGFLRRCAETSKAIAVHEADPCGGRPRGEGPVEGRLPFVFDAWRSRLLRLGAIRACWSTRPGAHAQRPIQGRGTRPAWMRRSVPPGKTRNAAACRTASSKSHCSRAQVPQWTRASGRIRSARQSSPHPSPPIPEPGWVGRRPNGGS